jgi:superfamily II DNA/RNA helicase
MFDPITASFVRSAAALPGLDPATLVDELTAAYVDIAAARLSLGTENPEPVDLGGVIDRMSRLADTYEAEIVLDVQSDRRRSIAFVAGSARQVLTQIRGLVAKKEGSTPLSATVIGAEISASLLFLIAQRSSDAYEASRAIVAAGEPNAMRRGLILALGRFARGNFEQLLEINPDTEKLDLSDATEFATDLLFREILRGMHLLAGVGLGQYGLEAIGAAIEIFKKIQTLAIEASTSDVLEKRLSSTSVFAGPHHLAALLEKVAGSFGQDILVSIPPPTGSDPGRWNDWLRSEASRWPFLWENHRDAIATGYLNEGASLVMTTPTGSGKTTLAALKIAATLARGKTVLYLAPTHALVGQVENDLNERVVGLAKAASIEDMVIDEAAEGLPDIAVVTPERCFALLTFAPDLFANVGLLVFDEFHLLGVNLGDGGAVATKVDRRAIDAMLCLLTFQSVQKNADFLLLSAMVSNGGDIADWLHSITGRPVTAFDYKWKPTRQVRSCVLYDQTELTAQQNLLSAVPPNRIPEAVPYGIFSLAAGWYPNLPDKLLLRRLSQVPIRLGIGSNRRRLYLTSNRFGVASAIAKSFADSGLKVIVFCDSIVNCGSVANTLNGLSTPFDSPRDEEQEKQRQIALEELGKESAIYDAGTQIAAVHHGELLPSERRLVETLFRRRDSKIKVLAATSTLAQGLNLPCDVVILASIDRLDESDPEEKTRSRLEPHEILNALGRSGRAGQAATGYSIVIPGHPTGFDMGTKQVQNDQDLALVFAEGDQCLPIADPITALFDIIETQGSSGDDAEYLLRRLAISLGAEREGVETFEGLTRRTFGFHQKQKVNDAAAESWLAQRKQTLIQAIAGAEPQESLPWQEELAAKTGVSSKFIVKLATAYENAPVDAIDASVWVVWLLDQFDPSDKDTDVFLRLDTMVRVFGRAITSQDNIVSARAVALKGIRIGFNSWFAGESLCQMEVAIAAFVTENEGAVKRPTKADKKAKRARRFALRLATDFGFLCGVLSQISQRLAAEREISAPPMIGFLPQLTRYGYETPYHFALSRDGERMSRKAVQEAFTALQADIERLPTDDWNAVRTKLDNAQVKAMFTADLTDFEAIVAKLKITED